MPELWAAFDPPDAEDPDGVEDYNLITLGNGDWDALFEKLDIPSAMDMIGIERDEYEFYQESAPKAMQKPWNEEMANWQDPQDGIDWADDLLRSKSDWPVSGPDADYMQEQLEAFERELTRAKAANLKFHLFVGT